LSPYAEVLLRHLALQTLVLVLDDLARRAYFFIRTSSPSAHARATA
jgi:hypothetical protein